MTNEVLDFVSPVDKDIEFDPPADEILDLNLQPPSILKWIKSHARELTDEHADSPYLALLEFSTDVFQTRPVYVHRYIGNVLYHCDVFVGGYTFRTTEAKDTLLRIEDDAAKIALERFGGDSEVNVNGTFPLLVPLTLPRGSHILKLDWLCDLNDFAKPDYKYLPLEDGWKCCVAMFDHDMYREIEYGETFTTSKDAQEDAAKRMIQRP